MKKKAFSLLLTFVLLFSALPTCISLADAEVLLSVSFYDIVSKNKNFEVNNNAARMEAAELDGVKVLKITPTPDIATEGKDANFNFYGGSLIKLPGKDAARATRIEISYYYALPEGVSGNTTNMQIVMLANGGAFTSNLTANSEKSLESNKWSTATFEIGSAASKLATGEGEIKQVWLRPYGPSPAVLAKSLDSGEVLYLGELKIYAGTSGQSVVTPPKQDESNKDDILQNIPSNVDTVEPKLYVDYPSKVAKIYDDTGVLNKNDSVDGISCLSITPTPDLAAENKKMNLDVYNLGITAEDLKDVLYLGIPYKYVVPERVEPVATAMQVNTLSGSSHKHTALNAPVANRWTEAFFDIRDAAKFFSDSGNTLNQLHFYPYGNALGRKMDKGEIMYIGKFKLYDKYPVENAEFELKFITEHPKAVGEGIPTVKMKAKEEIILPDSPWTVEGATFVGWKSSVDGMVYPAYKKLLMNDGPMQFIAEFKEETPNEKILKFTSYHNGTVNGLKYCKEVSNVTFDNVSCVKVVPNNEYENADSTVTVDGYQYDRAAVSLSEYKYAAAVYYCTDPDPKENLHFGMNFMTNGGALKSNYKKTSEKPLEYGRWSIATFDFSDVESYINPDNRMGFIRQVHIKPFGETKMSEFSGNETIYISNIIFFKEKPSLQLYSSYMKGYEDGIFNPGGNMTRAEACTIVARLSAGEDALVPSDKTTAFTDVSADSWYYRYVSYVESLGYLKSYGEKLNPDSPIKRAEFVELVYNMGLLKDAGGNGSFTDVSDSHERASVISAAGKAGLVNGYANGDGTYRFMPDATITRAEVVKVINNAYGRNTSKENISEDAALIFYDVNESHWACFEIYEAVYTHLKSGERWLLSLTDASSLLGNTVDAMSFEKGEAFVLELDGKSALRAEEIRKAPTKAAEIIGTTYYVSADGNDENDGKTPETAWKTAKRTESEKLKRGDAVLFRRGDTFRGQFKAEAGVLYSAYGDGDKPKIYGSPENGADASKWTLLEGTTNIWMYSTKMVDVGAIVLDGSTAAWKISPKSRNGKFYNNDETEFSVANGLSEDLSFVSYIPSGNLESLGNVYLRCDKGNPGELYKDIEFNIRGNLISIGGSDVTIDSLCIMYTGSHGVGAGTTEKLSVTNCEIGWIGGAIQTYNYRNTTDGSATRFGNGVEIYGSANGYTVDGCYIHHCFDAGVTHQYHGKDSNHMYDVRYTNNLIEDCAYSIEYFNSDTDPNPGTVYDGRNYLVSGNILRRAGNSFGRRFGNSASTHLKGWTSENKYDEGTYVIENNIFDRACGYLIQTPAKYREWLPVYRGNTFVQTLGGLLGYYDGDVIIYDVTVPLTIKTTLKDETATVYFVREY